MNKIIGSLMMLRLMMGGGDSAHRHYGNGVSKSLPPWYHEHLTKSERKGLSYEEMQKLRKAKWMEG